MKKNKKPWASDKVAIELYNGSSDGGILFIDAGTKRVNIAGVEYEGTLELNRRGLMIFIHRKSLT